MRNESSGVGLPAVCAKRLPLGRVPGTTALLAVSTTCRAPQDRAVVKLINPCEAVAM